MWGHERNNLFEGPFLFDSNDTLSDPRFEYGGDRQRNCSLTIHQVRRNDSGEYAFRFVTDLETGKFTGVKGPELAVFGKVFFFAILFTLCGVIFDIWGLLPGLLGLSVSPRTIGQTKEGDSVSLTCRSGCNGTQDSFTWFKDGVFLRGGRVLNLSDVSPSDSGNYSCSLSVHPGTTSGVRLVDVECEHRTQTSISSRKKDNQLMVNISFQTAPRTHLQACRWRRTLAEKSPWSAAAARTRRFRATPGSGSRTASGRLETSLRW